VALGAGDALSAQIGAGAREREAEDRRA